MKWLRLYAEVLNDPKVQRLPAGQFKLWVNLLCLAAEHNGRLPADEDTAFALRLSADAWAALRADFLARGLLDEVDGGLAPHNWNRRQYASDDVTARTRRFRERSQERSSNEKENGSGTFPRTTSERPQKQSTDHRSQRSSKQAASTDRQPTIDPLEAAVCAALGRQRLEAWERMRLTALAASYAPEVILAAVAWAKEHCRSPSGVLSYAARCIGDTPWDAEPETPSGAPVQRLEDGKAYFERLAREYGDA